MRRRCPSSGSRAATAAVAALMVAAHCLAVANNSYYDRHGAMPWPSYSGHYCQRSDLLLNFAGIALNVLLVAAAGTGRVGRWAGAAWLAFYALSALATAAAVTARLGRHFPALAAALDHLHRIDSESDPEDPSWTSLVRTVLRSAPHVCLAVTDLIYLLTVMVAIDVVVSAYSGGGGDDDHVEVSRGKGWGCCRQWGPGGGLPRVEELTFVDGHDSAWEADDGGGCCKDTVYYIEAKRDKLANS